LFIRSFISPAVKRSVSLLLLIAGFFVSGKAQETGDFFKRVQQAQGVRLQEKLYLHLDKNSYVAGEMIWFKIYCTVGLENLLSNGSKVAYVELIGADQRRAKLIKIPLYNGLGVGDIALPDTLTEGSYRLRAYTNWMRNDEAIYFFDRTLAIGNGRSDQVFTQTTWQPNEQGGRYQLELRAFAQVPIVNTDVNVTFTQPSIVVNKSGRTSFQFFTSDEPGTYRIIVEGLDMYGNLFRQQKDITVKR